MTKKEEIYAFIKSHKKVTGGDIWRQFGNMGSVRLQTDSLVSLGKINVRLCECGNCKFYEVKK